MQAPAYDIAGLPAVFLYTAAMMWMMCFLMADAFEGGATEKKLFQQPHGEGTGTNGGVTDFDILQALVDVGG